ncbi:MAG TPA: hypothetical protein VMB51_05225 [Solirubrobacteraceae bacterium]|nr:hypothetical protein [Solirubrobacteraceae bacterium]
MAREEEFPWECDRCECTTVCSRRALTQTWGWRVHEGSKDGKPWQLVLCSECCAPPKKP